MNKENRITPFEAYKARLGTWEITTLKREEVLSKGIQKQAIDLTDKWINVFPKESTWIQQNYGIPSLLVRFDGIDDNGILRTYEIEDRPAGIGHTNLINPDFKQRLSKLRETWPEFDVAISPLRDPADDKLWCNVVDKNSATGLVFVRAEPEEMQFRELQSRSVSTIATEGDKSYGVALGLWKFIDSPTQFPRRRSFVLKALQSSKGRNMAFYDVRSRPGPGNVKMKNAEKLLIEQVATKGGMYIQELIPPMQSGIDLYPFMIYRFFLGYDFKQKEWVPLGGTYFARNNLKIHGASDSVSGPLVIE